MFSIRDSKAETFHQPWFAKNQAEAERNFTQLARDEKSTISQFPEDYDLYYIGTYDDERGVADPVDTPQHIAKAIALKQQ